MRLLLPSVLVLGCSALWPGEPGSPEGGRFCVAQAAGKPQACYATERERGDAQNQIDIEQRELSEANHRARQAAQSVAEDRAIEARKAEAERQHAEKTAERDRVYAERHRQRQAEADAKAARAAELKAMASDPKYAVPAISAIMCSIQDELLKLRADLAREQRVTATSGVTNLRARDEIGREIVDDQDELAGWRAALQRHGAAQLPCKAISGIVGCRNNLESCDEASRTPAEVWAREQDTLWSSDKPRPTR